MSEKLILAINPGSTSTKVAVFKNEKVLFSESVQHEDKELMKFDSVAEQLDYRLHAITIILKSHLFKEETLSAVVGRGGFLHPLKSGTYLVNQEMLEDLKSAKYGEHASNLGALLAQRIAERQQIPAFIVDPIVVDELADEARRSGLPDIQRQSHVHALNVKAVVRKVAQQLNKNYRNSSFVVAHLGGGISIVAHQNGKAIDVNNANNEGPFSPERAGGLPACQLVKLCYSGNYSEQELLAKMTRQSGLYGYLGTKDAREIENRVYQGNKEAKSVFDAMIYQIAKEIGAMATVLKGEVDGIILTGGLSYSKYIVDELKKRIQFLAEVYVVPGEEELHSLAEGALRVLQDEEEALPYRAKDMYHFI